MTDETRNGDRRDTERCPARHGSVSGETRNGVRRDTERCPARHGTVSGETRISGEAQHDARRSGVPNDAGCHGKAKIGNSTLY